MPAMDDRRVGLLVRALRRRRRWRQADLAEAAGVSQSTVSRLERGHLDVLDLRVIRRMLGAVEARGELDVRWRGGLSDQLLDERHAALGMCAAVIVQGLGWQVIPEVTFQHFGERGSIDLFASQRESRAVCIIELEVGGLLVRGDAAAARYQGTARSSGGRGAAGVAASRGRGHPGGRGFQHQPAKAELHRIARPRRIARDGARYPPLAGPAGGASAWAVVPVA